MSNQLTTFRMDQKFKKTPVGEIPVDWDARSIKSLVKAFLNGGTPDTKIDKYWQGDIPWITGADFINQKAANFRRFITKEAVENSATNVIPKGSILVVTRTGVGKLAIAPCDVAISQDITAIIPNSEEIVTEFLFWELNFYANQLRASHQGTSIGILRSDPETFTIPVPPLQEQKKIAEILSAVDDAIEKTDAVIGKAKNLKKGLMQQLMTKGIGHKKFKKTPLGEIPEEWAVNVLGNHITIKHGWAFKGEYFGSEGPILLTPGNFLEAGGLYFNDDNIKRYTNKYPKEFELTLGELIVVMTDLTPTCKILGVPAFAPNAIKTLHNQRIGKVVFDSEALDKTFLYYLFLHPSYKIYMRTTAAGTTARHTAPGRIGNYKFALPPLSEQKQIAEMLSVVDEEITNGKSCSRILEQTKKSLMYSLLTGKTRARIER